MLGEGARRKAAPPGCTAAPRHHSTIAHRHSSADLALSPSRSLARSLSPPPCPVSTPLSVQRLRPRPAPAAEPEISVRPAIPPRASPNLLRASSGGLEELCGP
ncbi:hypothetical protein BS50DRAFT_577959 [Corynespora cassiicola Philippines]|uniref:Uncharacterized protein n=1 Tax=Corynespora cassiicola Philippines TaxID=1448308 RepID=A0A2T2N9L7_CORCC|nr:hypothetical protein BS50DRAFT_577959 [Corynespora cassiicola Philippines]